MPGMNGTGPAGEGPRTGWGSGRCRPPKKQQKEESQVEETGEEGVESAPEPAPGFGGGQGRRRGRGQGQGRGRGRGRGRGGGQGN